MNSITKESFDEIIDSGDDLLLFVYNSSAASQILNNTIAAIENLVGREFKIFGIDGETEKEIPDTLMLEEIPAIVRIANKKIKGKIYGIKKENEILAMFK